MSHGTLRAPAFECLAQEARRNRAAIADWVQGNHLDFDENFRFGRDAVADRQRTYLLRKNGCFVLPDPGGYLTDSDSKPFW